MTPTKTEAMRDALKAWLEYDNTPATRGKTIELIARARDLTRTALSTEQEDGPLREALKNARIDFACIADYAGATDGIKHVAQSAIREIDATLLSTKQEGGVPQGCPVCGVGADGKPMGYVCPRNDCPTKAIA